MTKQEQNVAAFSIAEDDHQRFVRLSGDRNPIHIDHEVARRSTFGARVVHGMNAALAALELAVGKAPASEHHLGDLRGRRILRMTLSFLKPVFVDEDLILVRKAGDDQGLRLIVRAGKSDLVRIAISFESGQASAEACLAPLPASSRRRPAERKPVARRIEEHAGLKIDLPLCAGIEDMQVLYPRLTGWFGERRLAGLALLSTLVGMEWPGLLSLLTKVKIDFRYGAGLAPHGLTMSVTSADAEHGMTTGQVVSPDFIADIEAFFRPPQVVQPDAGRLRERIPPDLLRGWTAVVVGGSRGLGEVAAKLSAAAGADTILTYRKTEREAIAVRDDILAAGGRCGILEYDVSSGRLDLPENEQRDRPVLLFYSASPQIFRRRTRNFSPEWFDEFLAVYVHGFLSTLDAVREWCSGPIAVLYPSSQALDEASTELAEYAAAKAAGEAICRSIAASDARWTIEMPRLPRMLTDQTNSIVQAELTDSVDALLPFFHRLAQKGQTG